MEDFEQWAHARRAALARSAYLLTGDIHLAEDLLQETLTRVAQHWRRVRRQGAPNAYARRVMHHLAVDSWRRRRVRPAELLGAVAPEGSHVDADADRRLVLRDALARLTPRQRAILSLRFYEDLTEVETAAVLGCSVSTVKSTAREALARLRAIAPDQLAEFASGENP